METTETPSSPPSESLPTASPTETPLLLACVCSPLLDDIINNVANGQSGLYNIGGTNQKCTPDNHLTKEVAEGTELKICVFGNGDPNLNGYDLIGSMNPFTMYHDLSNSTYTEIVSMGSTAIGDDDDTIAPSEGGIVQMDQGSKGKTTSLTTTRPILEVFPSLYENFGGTLKICGVMPLNPGVQLVRPEWDMDNAQGGAGTGLARPELDEVNGNVNGAMLFRPADVRPVDV